MNTSATTTDIAVVTPESGVSLSNLTLDTVKFVSEANLAGGSNYKTRRMLWATGNANMWAADGRKPLDPARGFILDQPDEDELYPEDYELLDAMEVLVGQGKAREVMIEHQLNGKPTKRLSWQLFAASLYVVCEGVPSESDMKADVECRWGVAYTPFRGADATSGKTLYSEVHFVGFIKELMDAGYPGSFLFKFSSYVTSKALACLGAQEYALRFVNQLRANAGHEGGLPYYALALPLQCSTSTMTAGKEAGKTKEVYYPVPMVPRLSLSRPEPAMAYLASVAITAEQAAIIEDGDRVGKTRIWSIEFSKRLIAGFVVDEATAPIPGDEVPPFTDNDIPEGLR